MKPDLTPAERVAYDVIFNSGLAPDSFGPLLRNVAAALAQERERAERLAEALKPLARFCPCDPDPCSLHKNARRALARDGGKG